jgi:hypothetical protein
MPVSLSRFDRLLLGVPMAGPLETTTTSSATSASASTHELPTDADRMESTRHPTQAVERDMRDLAADVSRLAQTALAATEVIKTDLRTEIDGLVVSNTTLLRQHKALATEARTAWGNTTMWDTMCSRFEADVTNYRNVGVEGFVAQLGWVDALERKADHAEADAARLEQQMNVWTTSIGNVELEVTALEQTALTLAASPTPAQNMAALRAHAGTITSLSALEANLQRQVTLLTTLRDAGVDLQGTLKTHIDDLNTALAEAAAAKARSTELFKVFIDIVCAADPSGAAEDYLRKVVADRVRDVLHDAGVTPEAFTDQILKNTDPAIAQQLRPRLIEAFATALPPVFSTGQLDG